MSGQKTYCKYVCPYCGNRIGANGASRAAHGRMHVRTGEAIEVNHMHIDYRGQIEFIPNPEYKNKNR